MAKAAAAAIPAAMSLAGGIAGAASSKGGGTQTATTSSSTQLPDWVTGQAKSNLARANDVADNLMTPYAGPRVADLNNGQTNSIDTLWNGRGMSMPGYQQAQTTLNGLQSFDPRMISAGQLRDTDLTPYMNPFTQNVIDTSMQTLEQQRKQALAGVGGAAASQKAFGGSRQGVQEGVTNAQSAIGAGQLAAGLNQANFTQAQGAAGQDIASRFAADSANQNADLSGAGLRLNAANSGAANAGAAQQSWQQSVLAGLQGQSMLQGQDQAKLDAARQLYGEQQQYPVQQLSILQSALGQTPYGSTTTGQQQQQLPGGNGLMAGFGGALSGLGAAGSLFGGGGAFPLVGANSVLK
jgi:hypothetical protein